MSMKLKDIGQQVSDRISCDNIALSDYITTDCILQNKAGRTIATNLPPQKCNLTYYKKGDVLIANIRPYLRKIWLADSDGGCSADVLAFRAKTNHTSEFLYSVLMQDSFYDYVMKASKGSKMPRGDINHIMNFPIISDELDEVEIGKLIISINKKISINREINRNLEELAKQIYDYWFVQFDFPNEDGKPYKTSGGKMVWDELLKREIPSGWEAGILDEIIEIKRGKTITEKQTTSGTIKVVAAGLTYSYFHGESNRTANCITVSGSGENAGFVNFWREPIFASDCSTIQFESEIDTIFCYYTLKKHEKRFYQISHKSGQPHILPSDIGEIPMVFPSKSIKDKTASFFINANKQIAENTRELELLFVLRDTLLPLLMNGQVTLNSCLSAD